jgi:hypothetical protein
VGIEVTQGVQFDLNGQGSGFAPDNSLTLVAGKPTLIRVYAGRERPPQPRPGLPTRQVPLTGTLTYRPVGAPRSQKRTLHPIFPRVEARPAAELKRVEFRHSVNFLLPPRDCRSSLALAVGIFDYSDDNDPALASGSPVMSSLPIEFAPVPVFRLHPMRVHYTGGGLDLPPVPVEVYAEHLFKLVREFPLAEVSLADCLEIDFDGDLNLPAKKGCCGAGWYGLLDRLDCLREEEDPDGIYVALLPDEAGRTF